MLRPVCLSTSIRILQYQHAHFFYSQKPIKVQQESLKIKIAALITDFRLGKKFSRFHVAWESTLHEACAEKVIILQFFY